MADFDPYHKWLGIPPKDQPPNHYRLLAIELFESDPDVIESAADQRMAHVRTFQTGQNSAVSQRILNELSAAKLCLLNPQKRAEYDRQLREKTQAAGSAVLPVTAGEGRGEGGGTVLPLPLGDGRGEGGRPRPLPKATPLTADQPAPVVIKSSPSEFSIHKRPRRPPVWQQPAVLAGFAAAAIILPLGIYFLKSGNQEPAASPRKATSVRSSPTVVSGGKHDPKTVPSKPVTTPAPPSVPAASAKPDFEIIDATWGTGDKWVNVTDGVRKQVKNNRLMMMVWSNLFGSPEDPAKGVGKVLRIRYRSRGKQYVADFPDVYFVYLDGNPLAPPTDSPGGLELLEARFGAGLAYADVLPQLREHLRDGRLWVPADEFADTTADELAKDNIHSGTYKVLWIRYRNGTGEHFTYAWNDNPVVIESRLPDAAGPPVDLLKSIDLKRDVVDGEWKLADGVLHAPGTHGTRVQLPLDAPDEYTLTVVAESEPEIMDISVLLPVGGKQVMSVIDGFGGVTSGLQVVNGWRADSNPSYRWRCARMFERARPNTLVYIVRRTSLRVLRDGAEVIRWSGNPAGFSIADGWKVPNHRRIALEAYETPYRVTKLELVPLAPEKSPMLTELEPGKRVDLLKHIDLDRDLLHGHWEYDGQSLVSPDSDKGLFQLPAVVPDSYRLDAVAQREHGNDCLTIMLPIGGKSAALILDGHGGKLSGLQAIDGKNIDANETKYEEPLFADGKPKAITITVRKNQVQAVCDGKQIVDWTGDVERLSANARYHDRVYLGDWYSRYRLTKIEVTPLGSEGADGPPALDGPPSAPEPPKPSVPLASAESVDLLKQVDMARDHVNGNWKRDAEALVSPRLLAAKMELPFAPSGDYELTIVAERLSGNDSFIVGLVIDGRQVAMTLDGYGGETAGLADLDHHDGAENATTRRGRLLPPGKPHTVVCTVRGSSLRVTCDGEPVIAWSGDAARLSNSDFWQVHDKRRLYGSVGFRVQIHAH